MRVGLKLGSSHTHCVLGKMLVLLCRGQETAADRAGEIGSRCCQLLEVVAGGTVRTQRFRVRQNGEETDIGKISK